MYAIVENSRTGKIKRFATQDAFAEWARIAEHPIVWDFVGGTIYDIFGDRSLAEHVMTWDRAAA